MKKIKKGTASLLVFSLLMSVFSFLPFSTSDVNAIETDKAQIFYSGDYYDELGGLENLVTSTDGESVFYDLRALIDYSSNKAELSNGKTISGTDKFHPSYTGLKDYWPLTEKLENDTNSGMRMFYTQEYSSTGWNREHVWPKSIAIAVGDDFGSSGKTGGGNDLHHLRPTYIADNSMHYHSPYGEIESGGIPYYCKDDSSTYIVAYVTDREWSSEDRIMEPVDSYKGDIARIFAYLVTHYKTLSQVIDKALVGGFETLVKWNELDPVDGYETYRNGVIEGIQGNRNPFIDCPDLINVIWGDAAFNDTTDADVSDFDKNTDKNTDTTSDILNSDNNSDTDKNTEIDNNTETDINSDNDNYISLTDVNSSPIGDSVVTRGQVVYIYGSSTVILENILSNGDVESLQVYDKSGVSAGKYKLNSLVELSGTVDLYNNTAQLKNPSIKVISENNTPIKPKTITVSEAKSNVAKYVKFENVLISAVDSSNSVLTDKDGNKINVYKMAALPDGVDENTLCDVSGATYIYNNEVQLRVQNTEDITVHTDEDTSSDINSIDTDTSSDNKSDDTDTTTDTKLVDTDTTTDTKPVDTDTTTDTKPTDTDTNSDSDTINYGDVNGDGYLTMLDIVIAQKYIAKLIDLTEAQIKALDVEEKFGEVTMADVVCLQKKLANIISVFPIQKLNK